MTDDDKKKEEQEVESTLKKEGIVIESENAVDELQQELGQLQSKEVEKELFDTIGVEMPEATRAPDEPTTEDLKKGLGSGGIEILEPEPEDEADPYAL